MSVEYIIDKSSIPILFIDTFALISYGKNEDSRVLELLDLVSKKVKKGKLICPIADQIEEVDNREYTDTINKAVSAFYYLGFENINIIREKQLL
jgi:hypothetical protein